MSSRRLIDDHKSTLRYTEEERRSEIFNNGSHDKSEETTKSQKDQTTTNKSATTSQKMLLNDDLIEQNDELEPSQQLFDVEPDDVLDQKPENAFESSRDLFARNANHSFKKICRALVYRNASTGNVIVERQEDPDDESLDQTDPQTCTYYVAAAVPVAGVLDFLLLYGKTLLNNGLIFYFGLTSVMNNPQDFLFDCSTKAIPVLELWDAFCIFALLFCFTVFGGGTRFKTKAVLWHFAANFSAFAMLSLLQIQHLKWLLGKVPLLLMHSSSSSSASQRGGESCNFRRWLNSVLLLFCASAAAVVGVKALVYKLTLNSFVVRTDMSAWSVEEWGQFCFFAFQIANFASLYPFPAGVMPSRGDFPQKFYFAQYDFSWLFSSVREKPDEFLHQVLLLANRKSQWRQLAAFDSIWSNEKIVSEIDRVFYKFLAKEKTETENHRFYVELYELEGIGSLMHQIGMKYALPSVSVAVLFVVGLFLFTGVYIQAHASTLCSANFSKEMLEDLANIF